MEIKNKYKNGTKLYHYDWQGDRIVRYELKYTSTTKGRLDYIVCREGSNFPIVLSEENLEKYLFKKSQECIDNALEQLEERKNRLITLKAKRKWR